MIKKNFYLVFNLNDGSTIETGFKVVQNDVDAYTINAIIYEGPAPIDYTLIDSATITYVKADGKIVQRDMTVEANRITCVIKANEISVLGIVKASIQLYGGNDERLSLLPFTFEVTEDIISPPVVESTNEFPILQKLIQDVNSIIPMLPEVQQIAFEMPGIIEFFDAAQTSESQRIAAEAGRIENENTRQTQEAARQASMADIENRFYNLTAQQQQDAEVIDARMGKPSLRAKIEDIETQIDSHMAESAYKTIAEKTWYVDATLGNDDTGDGTLAKPFKTIQKAWDSMPNLILHQQTIQLAAGTYNAGEASNVRPSVLYADKKFTGLRTDRSSNLLNGSVIIKGVSGDPTQVVIETTSELTYGIYNVQGQIGLEDITLKAGTGFTTNALLVSHRKGSYIHGNNVKIDGNAKQASYGAYTEAGGGIELTGYSEIKDCITNVIVFSRADTFTVSAYTQITGGTTGANVQSGKLTLSGTTDGTTGIKIDTCTTGINVNNGGMVEITGDSGYQVQINSPVVLDGGSVLTAVYTDFDTIITSVGSNVKLTSSNYQNRIQMDGGLLHLNGTNSYISPSTANSTSDPVRLLSGAKMYEEGTNNIKASGGTTYTPRAKNLNVKADGATITLLNNPAVHVNGNGALRSNCVLSVTDIKEGTQKKIFGTTWGVQIIDSTTAVIAGGSITLGGSSGQYAGIDLVFYSGKWREVSRSLIRP